MRPHHQVLLQLGLGVRVRLRGRRRRRRRREEEEEEEGGGGGRLNNLLLISQDMTYTPIPVPHKLRDAGCLLLWLQG